MASMLDIVRGGKIKKGSTLGAAGVTKEMVTGHFQDIIGGLGARGANALLSPENRDALSVFTRTGKAPEGKEANVALALKTVLNKTEDEAWGMVRLGREKGGTGHGAGRSASSKSAAAEANKSKSKFTKDESENQWANDSDLHNTFKTMQPGAEGYEEAGRKAAAAAGSGNLEASVSDIQHALSRFVSNLQHAMEGLGRGGPPKNFVEK
jgi:hypothetical protein